MEPKEKLLEEVITLISKVNQGIESSVVHTPDIVQQFILWEQVKGGIFLLLFLTSILVGKLAVWNAKKADEIGARSEGPYIIGTGLSTICAVGAAVVGFCGFLSHLSAWVAPKWHIVSTFMDKL